MRPGLARAVRLVVGDHPSRIAYFALPTFMAIGMDFVIRARALVIYPPLEVLNYFGSSLASAGFWSGPLWIASYLVAPATFGVGWKRHLARAALGLFLLLFVVPFALFSYGGQALYHRVFGAYMARDTVRVGIALRGTLHDWLTAWGGSWIFVALVVCALPPALAIAWAARRAASSVARTIPALPVVGFGIAVTCFYTDFVESRSLQAAPPDTCFIHGVVHALRDAVSGKGWVRHGFTLRRPAPLPSLAPAPHRPNVVVILTESVRADAVCSAPPPDCKDTWLDPVVPDRIPLGTLVSQSSGTFSACMMLWTGLPPTADLKTVHEAPVLWEIARAEGYRTAYVTSQNLRYDDFGAFVERAGIDELVSAIDLGDTRNAQMGAPDELATARMLDFIRGVPAGQPYFGILHFSNTHSPYRADPSLRPFTPESDDPLGDLDAFFNHYKNSVAMQQRMVQGFLRTLRGLPGWDDTVVLYLSDHGEAFREHGRLYHLNTLYDEEVRIPGWLAAGPRVLDDEQRESLRVYRPHRTFSQDVYATVVDLLGAHDAHAQFPFAAQTNGRSLLRRARWPFPVQLTTQTAVWEPDDPKMGMMTDERLLVRGAASPWKCYDLKQDPEERAPLDAAACGPLVNLADRAFPAASRR